jgi:hypothetical protein
MKLKLIVMGMLNTVTLVKSMTNVRPYLRSENPYVPRKICCIGVLNISHAYIWIYNSLDIVP